MEGRGHHDLLESLMALYEYLITTLKKMLRKKLTMKYVTIHLMHELLKRKKIELQNKDVAMISRQSKANNPPLRQDIRMCFYCSKPSHVT